MSLNNYDLCPCGSGKKIKFCKCNEYLAEMDKITRMVQGEQFVAALDQINSHLKTLPSEPWLLALKCDVLLRLGEGEALEEASAKFIRLQPDNPLARMNRAMVALMRGSLEEAATLYLQAICSPAVEVNSLLLTVLSNMIQFLTEYGNALPAYLHIELASDRFEGIEQYTASLLARLIQSNSLSLLSRDSIPSPPSCDDTEFAERYREAIAMMYNGDVPHAKTKLEGIQREFGHQSGILIALLHCKLYLIDTNGAAEICMRLVGDQGLDIAQRAYFFALATELNASKAGTAAKNRVVEYAIDDEEAVETQMGTHERLMTLRDESAKAFVQQLTGEEVPPRIVCDYRIPVETEKFADLKPALSIGLVAVYGRQTDKPARLLMIYTEGLLEQRDSAFMQILNDLGVKAENPLRDDSTPVTYIGIPNASVAIKSEAMEGKDIPEEELSDFVQQVRIDALLGSKFPAFNGKTLAEAAKDPAYQAESTGILLHFLASSQTGIELARYRQIHEQLGLAVPSIDEAVDGFDHVGAAYYYWVDSSKLQPTELLGLIRSAMQRQHVEVFSDYLASLQAAQFPEDMQLEVDLLKRQLALSLTRTPDERLEHLRDYYAALKANGKPAGQVGIAWFQFLSSLGRQQEASDVLRQVVSENQEDPAVREFVYMLNMQVEQMQRNGGRMDPNAVQQGLAKRAMGQAQRRSEESSGLWTPDQGSPSSSTASESSGGSGLWIPGQ